MPDSDWVNKMSASDWIAFGSAVFSIIALIISYLSSTKKYELMSDQRNRILDWFYQTTEKLITLKIIIENGNYSNEKLNDYLAQLSSLIEVGRFYFPNVDKRDGHGKEKPTAYRGYRNIVIYFLILYYHVCLSKEPKKNIKHMELLQRLFTSKIFEILAPCKYNKSVKRYTGMVISPNAIIDDFLSKDPAADYFKKYYM